MKANKTKDERIYGREQMIQDIYVIDDKNDLVEKLKVLFAEMYEFRFINVKAEELEVVLKNIPSLIIIDEDNTNVDIIDICNTIRHNDDNSITPIAVVSSNIEKEHRVKILETSVQYFIKKPIDEQYLFYTVKNIIDLLYANRKISPLTGLPGNVQIQAEMKKRLLNKEVFAILYVDLDNFKAYNDIYGFASGDEIIKFTARVISKYVHNVENSDNFIGHIGGDDFVAIISKTDYDKICQEIIIEFDTGIKKFYTSKDIHRGYVEIENRRGIMEQFPITTISVAVVEVDSDIFKSPLEIGEVGAQVKHRAKTIMGSAYVINRRKNIR